MEKNIIIKIDKEKIEFLSDNPNFSDLINAVIKNKTFDFNNIEVSCENDENFDCNSFKNAIVATIKSLLNNLSIDNEEFKNKMSALEKEKEALSEESDHKH